MSNKSYCMLCNAELISLVQPPAEYGYLCASCKIDVLKMRDYFQMIELQREAILNLGKPWKPFSTGKKEFPTDLVDKSEPIDALVHQQRLYNDIPSLMTETFKPKPISANQVMQWQKQEEVEKGQLFASPLLRNRSEEEFRREYMGEWAKADPDKPDNKE